MDSEANKKMKTSEGKTILDLEIYSLLHIFSFLNMRDLMITETVCTGFKYLAEETYRKFKVFNSEQYEYLTAAELGMFLPRIGQHIHTIKLCNKEDVCRRENELTLMNIGMYCKKLQNIHLMNFHIPCDKCGNCIPPNILNSLKNAFENVTKVHVDSYFPEYIARNIFNISQLTEFRLHQKHSYTFPWYSQNLLAQLQKIEVINLDWFEYEDEILFEDFCKANPQIHNIKIGNWWCLELNNNYIKTIVSNLRDLECVEIAFYGDEPADVYSPLMDLPKIKKLKLYDDETYIEDNGNVDFLERDVHVDVLIMQISSYNQLQSLDIASCEITPKMMDAIAKFTMLKELKISHSRGNFSLKRLSCKATLEEIHMENCTEITSCDLADFIVECKKIHFIDLSNNEALTDDFIPKILEHLGERSHTLVIKIHNTMISRGNVDGIHPRLLKLI